MKIECQPLHTFHLIGKKHFVPILDEFYHQKYEGFNILTQKLKITPKQLSERLHEMEEHKLVEKKGDTYSLTAKGKELSELIAHIKQFHVAHHAAPEHCSHTACSECQLIVGK